MCLRNREKVSRKITSVTFILIIILFILNGCSTKVSFIDDIESFDAESDYTLRIEKKEYNQVYEGETNINIGNIAHFMKNIDLDQTESDKNEYEFRVKMYDGESEIDFEVYEKPYIGCGGKIYIIDELSYDTIDEMLYKYFLITKYNLE